MTLTGICSEGTVYFAGRKIWATDTFHVFERFVSGGNQMPDGSRADRNYVWLSEWQLENINHNHLLPVDLEIYRQLRNHIEKALVPLLQVWLYATSRAGFFEKRYHDVCQILNITQYKHTSKIKEKLGLFPSMNFKSIVISQGGESTPRQTVTTSRSCLFTERSSSRRQ